MTNHIELLPPEDYARQLTEDRERRDWNFLHLARQSTAYRDAGKQDTAAAIYTRRAMKAILQGDTPGYEAAIDEIVKLCKGL